MYSITRYLLLAAICATIYARSDGLPIKFTGAPFDGSQDCTSCHTGVPANAGQGRIAVRASGYNPGLRQQITVTVEDSLASRWGFQLTARLRNDETKQAGSFRATNAANAIRVLCGPDGHDGPCNGAVEFVTHTPASGSGAPRTFLIDWIPPGRDSGDVVFYAAGLAANNDGTPNGDRTYTTSVRVPSAGCALANKPLLTSSAGVVNAANFQPGISSNSLISIFGNLFTLDSASTYRATGSDLVAGKLPVDLSCLGVEIAGTRIPLFYTQQDQINAQAPILTGPGFVSVTVIANAGTTNEIRSDAVGVQVLPFTPALFTVDGKTLAGQNGSRNNTPLSSASPARPGDIVLLYGTGFGLTDPVYQPGEFASILTKLHDTVTVTIGAVTLSPADIQYAGLGFDAPGLYQFNLRVPDSTPDGDVAVIMRIGGAQTQSGVTIPVKR
jgi:uncharacterized protein (TIGR03437 family)